MGRFRSYGNVDRISSPLFHDESSILAHRTLTLSPPFCSLSSSYLVEDELDFALDTPIDLLSTFYDLGSVTDLIRVERRTPFSCSTIRRLVGPGEDLCLRSLSDRVSALELSLDRFVNSPNHVAGDRKYSFTAETKGPGKYGSDRKYKWVAEVKGKGNGGAVEKSYKWTAEVKGKGDESPISRTYTVRLSTGEDSESTKKKKDKAKEKNEKGVRVVEIGEPSDHGAVILKQAFAKRAEGVLRKKGKRKELSPQDAAMMIQMNFRAYLIRRSQSLRALRELAIAKTKLKEIRALFSNFSYRRRLDRDAEERQRFSEKIIVLLLTVDAIEGADLMVRASKKSMVDELEGMLDVVDPKPAKSLSMKRRTFDMPDGVVQKELAAGVAQVVQMLDHEHDVLQTLEGA